MIRSTVSVQRSAVNGRLSLETGLTLIEILVAVTLMALLSAGLITALGVGIGAWSQTTDRLTMDRRVATANGLIHSQFAGAAPIEPRTRPGVATIQGPFFQGEPGQMRFVSSYSMYSGVRGGLQIVELQTDRGENGLRLLLTQTPYRGPLSLAEYILGVERGSNGPRRLFTPLRSRSDSLIVADQLESIAFSYLRGSRRIGGDDVWVALWDEAQQMPQAIRIDLEPAGDEVRLKPVSITAQVRARYSLRIR